MGETWPKLFHLWATWGRSMWLDLTNANKNTPYTFIDMQGRPWRSPSENPTGQLMSTWLETNLSIVCVDSERFTEQQLEKVESFTLQMAR